MKKILIALIIIFAGYGVKSQPAPLSEYRWTPVDEEGVVRGRHENAFGEYNNKLSLKGDENYIATESPNNGGGNLGSIEVFSMNHDWEKLFNGENLDGWQVKAQKKDRDKTFWTVEDGVILCNSLGSKDHGYIWLQSEKEFGDFEMRLKFKVSRENLGNSGVQVRSRYDDNAVVEGEGGAPGWLDGPQADIEPGNPWRNGLIYDETRTVKRWIYPSLPDWKIDKETHAPEEVIFYWEDQQTGWNDMTIICKGTNIKTFVNNVLVSDFDGAGILDSEEHKKHNVGMHGHIALQLHKNSENKIWFKDIEVRKL